MTVGALLILADAGFDQWSVFHRRKAKGEIFANALQRGSADDSLAARGIEDGTARVIGYFEAATIASGNAVEEAVAVVAPHRNMSIGEAGVASGCAEEKDVLLGGTDEAAHFFHVARAGGLQDRAGGPQAKT